MSKLLKIIVAAVGVFFTVILASLLYILTLDPNDHKNWIAAKFMEETGRELSLAGAISITYYPWLGLSVNDVTIGNDPAFSDTALFHVDSAAIRLKLLSLLQGQFEIDTVRIYGAAANLIVNEAGQNNWDIFGASPEAASEPAGNTGLTNIVLGGVDVRDASISYEDRSAGASYAISSLAMSTGELIYGDPIDFTVNFDAASSQPQLSAVTSITGTVAYNDSATHYAISPLQLNATLSGPNIPENAREISLLTAISVDLDADTLEISDLDLSAPGTQLNASVSGSNIQSGRPLYDISVNLAGDDLGLLFEIAEIDDLAARIASLDSREFDLALNMTADMGRGNITVSRLNAGLLGAVIEGDLAASNMQTDAPLIRGNLVASGPDLPALVEVLGQIQGGSDSELARYGRELSRVPDKAFSVNTAFDADIQQGSVEIPGLDLRLLGASITGTLSANNVNTDTPVFSGRLNASGPDLPLLLQIAGQLQGGTDSTLNQYGRQLRAGVNNRNFTINAEFDADMNTGNIQVPVLAANLLGFQLDGNLGASNLQDARGSINGALNFSGNNLREVLAAVGQNDLSEVIQSVQLDVGIGGSRDNISISPLNLQLALAGAQIPNSPVNVTLNADSRLNLDQETLTLDAFNLQGLGLNISGNVNASRIFDAREFNGNLNVAGFNLRQLLQQLNQEVPVTADNSVLQQVALEAAFNGSTSHLNLADLSMTLDDSNLNGSFSVSDFGNPALDLVLTLDRIDADRYLPSEPAQSTAGNQGDTEIPVATLRDLDLNAQLNIGNLTFSNLNMSDVALAMTAANGELTIRPATRLYGGSYTGSMTLDVRGDTPTARIDSSLSTINLGSLMQDYLNANHISGTGNVDFSVAASGTDTGAMKRSLNGSGNIQLQDGILQGVDVAAVLKEIEAMIRSQRLREIQRGQQTEFETFSSTLAINNGVVTTNNLLIESPGFQVTGRGTLIDLNTETLSFNLITTVDQSTATSADQVYDIGGYSLPIACTGGISAPRCLPDVQSILANAVQQRVGDLLQRALGGQQSGTDDPQPEQAPEQQENEEQADPAEELINQALDRLFR